MYNYSARRKQGLGSLRPGYQLGGPTDILIGNLLNWGGRKIYDRFTKTKEQREEEKYKKTMEMLGIRPYFGPNEKNDDEESTTTYGKSGIGGGILNALATMILGPIMGPIAMTIGRGVMNKSKGLGFFGGDGDGGSGIGPKVGPKTDYYTGSDEEDKDNEWDPTKPTGVPSHIGPTGQDIHGNGDTTTTTKTTTTSVPSHIGPTGHDIHGPPSNGETTTTDTGWADDGYWATGGRVSYSKGGLASLWQR